MACLPHPKLSVAGPQTRQFLWKNGVYNKGDLQTHLALCGGIFSVPDTLLAAFHAAIAEDADHGHATYLVELRKPVFPMLFDFDFHRMRGVQVTVDDFLGMVYVCHVLPALKLFFPTLTENDLRVVLSCASSLDRERDVLFLDTQTKERIPVTKSGYHLIFPGLMVDKKNALAVRSYVVNSLSGDPELKKWLTGTHEGRDVEYDEWEEVVDLRVLTQNGLRMLGARKADTCLSSKMCRTKIDKGRPYQVVATFPENEAYLMGLKTNMQFALTELSMRPQKQELSPFTMHVHAAEKTKGKRSLPNAVPDQVKKTGKHIPLTENDVSSWRTATFDAIYADQACTILEKRIVAGLKAAGVFQEWWPLIGEGFSTISVSEGIFPSAALYTRTNYCFTAGRCHNSNRTFFLIHYIAKERKYFLLPRCHSNGCRGGHQKTKEKYHFPLPNVFDTWHDVLLSCVNAPKEEMDWFRTMYVGPKVDITYPSQRTPLVEWCKLPFCLICDIGAPCTCTPEQREKFGPINFTRKMKEPYL